MNKSDCSKNREKGKVEIIEVDTGELFEVECEDVAQLIQAIRGTAKALDRAYLNIAKTPKTQEFIQVNQLKLKQSCAVKEITGVDYIVWLYCLGDMDYGGLIKSTQIEIANSLRLTASRVNKAFSKMRTLNMIESAGPYKGTPTFRVSEVFAIKGKRELMDTDDIANVIRAEDRFTENKSA